MSLTTTSPSFAMRATLDHSASTHSLNSSHARLITNSNGMTSSVLISTLSSLASTSLSMSTTGTIIPSTTVTPSPSATPTSSFSTSTMSSASSPSSPSSPSTSTSTSTSSTPSSTPSTSAIPSTTTSGSFTGTSTTSVTTSTTSSIVVPTTTAVQTSSLSGELTTSLISMSPVSTFSTTVYISTTDSHGSMTSYAPSVITSTSTSTMSDGILTTITAVIANPTLNIDTSTPSSFFQNRGAVVGVFILVALAVVSITLWIIFFLNRRRRTLRLEHDTAVSATLAAAGFRRASLDNDDDPNALSHRSRYGSSEFGALPMGPHTISSSGGGIIPVPHGQYNEDKDQYADYAFRDAYHDLPSPTNPHLNAPPSAFTPYRDRTSSASDGAPWLIAAGIAHGHHSHQSSGASLEPLLAAHQWRRSRSLSLNGNPPPSSALMPGFGPVGQDTSAEHSLARTDVPAATNGRRNATDFASLPPSRENGAAASRSPPPYTLGPRNLYPANATSRSALIDGGDESASEYGSEPNGVGEDRGTRQEGGGDAESSVVYEIDLPRPVLVVTNLPDASSLASLP